MIQTVIDSDNTTKEILCDIRNTLRVLISQRALTSGDVFIKSTVKHPLKDCEIGVIWVAPLAEEGLYAYDLESIKNLQRKADADPERIDGMLRWCAIGQPSQIKAAPLLLFAQHQATHMIHISPSVLLPLIYSEGKLEAATVSRFTGVDCAPVPGTATIAQVLESSRLTGKTSVLFWQNNGLLFLGMDTKEVLEEASRCIHNIDTVIDNDKGTSQKDTTHKITPVIRGVCKEKHPVICTGIRNARKLSASDVHSITSNAPVKCITVPSVPESVTEEMLTDVFNAVEIPASQYEPYVLIIPGTGAWSVHSDVRVSRSVALAFEVYIDQQSPSTPFACTPIPHPLDLLGYRKTKMPLSGQVAAVTGGSGGIGLAIAQRLAEEGACVALFDINGEKLTQVVDAFTEKMGEGYARGFVCDVCQPGSIEQAFREVVEYWGGLDILINCAGLSLSRTLEETSPEDYDKQNNVMPRGSFLCSREAAKIMRLQGYGGDIVYIASKNALFAGPNNVAYGTAKAAQLHQARLLAVELAPEKVRVNVVNPDAVVQGSGIFAGGWGEDRARTYGVSYEELGKFYASRSLLKEEVLPKDIAAAVYVLVGPELRKSTGLVLNVDSGFAPSMVR